MRIRAVSEPERVVRINALSRGSLIHRIFERFYAEATGPGPACLAPDAVERLRQVAVKECDRARQAGETGYPAMWDADRAELVEDCLTWLERERADEDSGRYSQVAVEARFGPAYPGEESGSLSRSDPMELELASGPLLVHGRIDRVEWSEGRPGFRVTDYKTGRVYGEKSGEFQGGRMLQLPLYVDAAAQLLGRDPSEGAAAYAYLTRRGGFTTVEWRPEDLTARRDELLAPP